MELAYIEHADFLKHEMGAGHPECPERILTIEKALLDAGMFWAIRRYPAPEASDKDLLLAHSPRHLELLTKVSPKSGYLHIDMDTAMNPHTLTAAKRAAGAGLLGLDLVLANKHKKVFCAVRPPGHHAERDKAMGFCFFNNIAIAAKAAVQRHGLSRVAVVDFDVHHGNGTEDILANDPSVLICSSFQSPFYPYASFCKVCPNIVNTELSPGTSSKEFRKKISETWLPKLDDFKPQLLLISAGFDAVDEDPLAELKLLPEDFGWITQKLCEVADRHAGGRIVSMLEGGYNLSKLGQCALEHVKNLLEFK